MIRDIPSGLLSAVAAINQKSREAYVAEQAAMRKPKLPGVPAPKADPAAVSTAKKMAEEAEGTSPTTPKEKKLAAMSGDKSKITKGDVLKARGVRNEEKEEKEELAKKNAFDWKNQPRQTSDGKTSTGHTKKKISTGTVYTKEESEQVEEGIMSTIKKIGKKVVDTVSHGSDEDLIKDLQKKVGVPQTGKKPTAAKPVKEDTELNTDTPGNSYEHQCAIHVKHSKLGEGRTLFSQHAEPDENGFVAWYDVMFAEGISRVKAEEIEVLEACSHANHTKKKAK
jgi:hypothetical protein